MCTVFKCCIIGDDPRYLPWRYNERLISCTMFKKDLNQVLTESIRFGFKTFYTGLNAGYELLATGILFELKKKFNSIRIIAVLPDHKYDPLTPMYIKREFFRLLKLCDEVIYLSNKEMSSQYLDVDDYMLKNTSLVITSISGNNSRAKYFVDKAVENQKYVKIIRP